MCNSPFYSQIGCSELEANFSDVENTKISQQPTKQLYNQLKRNLNVWKNDLGSLLWFCIQTEVVTSPCIQLPLINTIINTEIACNSVIEAKLSEFIA